MKHNPLAASQNWELVYAECRDEHVWAYIGPDLGAGNCPAQLFFSEQEQIEASNE